MKVNNKEYEKHWFNVCPFCAMLNKRGLCELPIPCKNAGGVDIYKLPKVECSSQKVPALKIDCNPQVENANSISSSLKVIAEKTRAIEKAVIDLETSVQVARQNEETKVYSSGEVAKMIGVCVANMRFLRQRGAIPFIKIGKRFVYKADIIDKMIAEGTLKKYGRANYGK